MNIEPKNNFKKNIANFFGALGYIFCALQWFWAILLYFSLIKKIALFIGSGSGKHVVAPATVAPISGTPLIIMAAVITVIVIIFTVYVIIKIPLAVAKTGKKLVHETAENATPLILKVQHRKDTNKNHKRLTSRLIFILKIIMIIAPIILSLMSRFIDQQLMGIAAAMYISVCLACLSVVSFVVQYFIAVILSVKNQYLW